MVLLTSKLLAFLLCLELSQVTGYWWPFSSFFSSSLNDVVDIPGLGKVRGKYEESRDGREFVSFNGVPFAETPERWLPAQLNEGWKNKTEELNCTEPREKCFQSLSFFTFDDGGEGSEDCLFLNIHTPATKGYSLLPVLVFFHGGGMIAGASNEYQPQFFMDHDVIVVTVNYRLGVLGFFSLDSGDISGNQGLRDAQLGLTWLKHYIEYFGGDPSRVTISGESGGSWLVSMLIASPLSEGLFVGAILQSGVAIGDVGYTYDTREQSHAKAKKLASAVNCSAEYKFKYEPGKLEACLRGVPLEKIMKAAFDTQVNFVTRGTLDPQSNHGSVLPYPLEDIFRFGFFQQVPILIGTTSQESLVFALEDIFNTSRLDALDKNWP